MANKNTKFFLLVSGLILLIAFCSAIWFIDNRINFLLNADDSSELVLGHLLSSENALLSPNWYYSTELRVINTQIFYAFFFKIFNDWHTVRVASYICLYIILLASYYFACCELRIKKYFLVTAALLMLPFSIVYFNYVLKGAYYIPHIAITFFTIGLYEKYIKTHKKTQTLYLLVASFSAILAGLGGLRQIFVLYIPLILAAFYLSLSNISILNGKIICRMTQETKKYILFSAISMIGSAIGYGVNVAILSKIFRFKQWNGLISFVSFDVSNLSKIINGFLSSFGYSTGKIFSSTLLTNFACGIWIILTIAICFYILKHQKTPEADTDPAHYRLVLLIVSSTIVFILMYIFTDLGYKDRYNLPIITLSIPMIAILFQNSKLSASFNYIGITLFILLITISSIFFYKGKYKTDLTADFRYIVTTLQREQRMEGYATFWHANILTELSNGEINVWDWEDNVKTNHITVSDINQTHRWLHPVSRDKTHPKGKIFLVFSQKEWKNNPWIGKLNTNHIIYQSKRYIVIGYDDYNQLRHDTAPKQ